MEAISTVLQRIEDTGDGKEMTRAMADVPASGIDEKINKRWGSW